MLLNKINNRCTPVSILGANKTFCSITGGQYHSIGLDKNGLIWGWGRNSNGQIGDNTTTQRLTPVSILGNNKTFCNITAGGVYAVSIDKNGLVWGWGNNNLGQLGDNTITQRLTPVSILGANKTFCKIATGYQHSLGLDKNGLVWGWGYNAYGQLGDDTITSQRTPVSILGANKTFCFISGYHTHSLGLDKYGRVWGWGDNANSQLGDSTTTSRRTPVSILGANKTFCSIAGGGYQYSLGIDKNGRVWGWGYNNFGQLGNNSITSRRTPIMITTI